MEGRADTRRMLAVLVRIDARIGGGWFENSYLDVSQAEYPIAKIQRFGRSLEWIHAEDALLVDAHAAGVSDVIVDMGHVHWLSSTGLGELVCLFHRIKTRGGRMVLVGVCERVDDILNVTTLNSVIAVRGSIAEALTFRARPDAG